MKKYDVVECECCGSTTRNPEGWWAISGGTVGIYIIRVSTGENVPNYFQLFCGEECLMKSLSAQLQKMEGGLKCAE